MQPPNDEAGTGHRSRGSALTAGIVRVRLRLVTEAAIVVAWLLGTLSGSVTTIGVASAVTARMVFNPLRIDWSAGEARALGALLAGQGVATGLVALVFLLQWAAYRPVPGYAFLILLITTTGFIGITFVGHHHNGRNPLKKWR